MGTFRKPTPKKPFAAITNFALIHPQPPDGLRAESAARQSEGSFRYTWENRAVGQSGYEISPTDEMRQLLHLHPMKRPDGSWWWKWHESVVLKYEFEVDGHQLELWIVEEPDGVRIEARRHDQTIPGVAPTMLTNKQSAALLAEHGLNALEDRVNAMEGHVRELYDQKRIQL